jgi:thiamine biosynthesis protein ThiS
LEDLEAPVTIAKFLEIKGVTGNAVVERNLVIVKRDTYDEVELQDGDQLEVVQAMAGG